MSNSPLSTRFSRVFCFYPLYNSLSLSLWYTDIKQKEV